MKNFILPVILIGIVTLGGVVVVTQMEKNEMVGKGDIAEQSPSKVDVLTEDQEQEVIKEGGDEKAVGGLDKNMEGIALNSGVTKYYDFSQKQFEKALDERKVVYLEFYATWCPICIAQESDIIRGLNDLNDPDVVGFRVNYKDSDTDEYEEKLANKYNVTYQHTKVILLDNEPVYNDLAVWKDTDVVKNLSGL